MGVGLMSLVVQAGDDGAACSAIAGTWGNGPAHHLPGKRRAVRPAVAGLRLVCATHDARVGDFGIADDAGFVDVFREARRNRLSAAKYSRRERDGNPNRTVADAISNTLVLQTMAG